MAEKAPKEAKREAGQRVNELKTKSNDGRREYAFKVRKRRTRHRGRRETSREGRTRQIASVDTTSRELTAFDITLPGIRRPLGAEHPVIKTMNEIIGVFRNLGYSVEEGPEIETDYYNFEALNFPPNHPARDTQDTLFIAGQESKPLRERLLLRTHTSPVQIRTMEKMKPPLRVVCPGKVHRNDAPGRHPLADLSSGRRAGGGYQHHVLRSEGHARSRHEGAVRIEREDAVLSLVLPFHRAQRGCADQLHFLRRQRLPRWRPVPELQGQRLD